MTNKSIKMLNYTNKEMQTETTVRYTHEVWQNQKNQNPLNVVKKVGHLESQCTNWHSCSRKKSGFHLHLVKLSTCILQGQQGPFKLYPGPEGGAVLYVAARSWWRLGRSTLGKCISQMQGCPLKKTLRVPKPGQTLTLKQGMGNVKNTTKQKNMPFKQA